MLNEKLIRSRMVLKDITPAEMAKQLRVSRQSFDNYLKNKTQMRLDVYNKLIEVLGISFEEGMQNEE